MNKRQRKNTIKSQLGLDGTKILHSTAVIREMLLSERDWYVEQLQGQLASFFKRATFANKKTGKTNANLQDLVETVDSIYDLISQKNAALFVETLSSFELIPDYEFDYSLMVDQIVAKFLDRIVNWKYEDNYSRFRFLETICGTISLFRSIEFELNVHSFDESRIEQLRNTAIALCKEDDALLGLSSEQLIGLRPLLLDDDYVTLFISYIDESPNAMRPHKYLFNDVELGEKLIEKIIEYSYSDDKQEVALRFVWWSKEPADYFGTGKELPTDELYKHIVEPLVIKGPARLVKAALHSDFIDCAPLEVRKCVKQLLKIKLKLLFPEVFGDSGVGDIRVGEENDYRHSLVSTILYWYYGLEDGAQLAKVSTQDDELLRMVFLIVQYFEIDYFTDRRRLSEIF